MRGVALLACCAGAQALFCFTKLDGRYCDNNYLKTCNDGKETASQRCMGDEECVSGGVGKAACGSAFSARFCSTKTDGYYCDGKTKRRCVNKEESSSAYCPTGCIRVGIRDASCGNTRAFCVAKTDGMYCSNDNYLMVCEDGNAIDQTYCFGTTCREGAFKKAACGNPALCTSKLDGSYCDEQHAVACKDKTEVHRDFCGSAGCSGTGTKAECGTSRFCFGKLPRLYCDGNVLKDCRDSESAQTSVVCHGGTCEEFGTRGAECRGSEGTSADKHCAREPGSGTACVDGMLVTCDGTEVKAREICYHGCKPETDVCCAGESLSCKRYSFGISAASAAQPVGLILLGVVGAALWA
eukprot:TRINITY_DN5858_c0_g1_i1.p1 TRINITY_DN5858_c0_g1~~TRINITY_DN5858_c0_g1_i1.p1  ORF type:complete len:353 (+),score=54.95 TRINITY_DN5858_c0_g1_i1:46-1104(+)